jgi:AcrR family transcriptional regulator
LAAFRGLDVIEYILIITPVTAARKSVVSRDSAEKRSRPGRPPSIDSAVLLSVAREVFLERGFRATTLEVATRAGVSEGVLFHRFKSKEGLFSAAMNFDAEEAPHLLLAAVKEIETLEVREGLVKLSTTLLEIGRVALPIMMMSWSNPEACSEMPVARKRAGFRLFLKELGSYLERKMDAGELRRMDAEVLARALLGAVHHYATTRILIEPGDTVIPEGMYVRGLVDLLLNGAVPSAETPSNRRFAERKPPVSKR